MITDKQFLSNLLKTLDAVNVTGITLPEPTTSGPDYEEAFFRVRYADQKSTVTMRLTDMQLYAYNFELDGHPVHIVVLDLVTVEPVGTALLPGHVTSYHDLICSWLGDTILSEHPPEHPIHAFAVKASLNLEKRGRTK